ncbi:hypothetical protein V6N13_079367 [Hibiscus sabdariffa]|uniref:Uncharacterized protein n=1 Tax=Hibiscus sabdariffa TaxID=183260 RepID=A0ABR2RRS0_9ROSI
MLEDTKSQGRGIAELGSGFNNKRKTAASAARIMDEQRRIACAETGRLTKDSGKQKESFKFKLPISSYEAADVRAEEVRVIEARIKATAQKEAAAVKEKQQSLS